MSPRGYFQNGTLNKDGIDGTGKNIKGQTWTWRAVMIGEQLKRPTDKK
jgi:hypothetical protein